MVNFMEKIVRQTLLFDFYGELLTEHQKSVYSDVISEDLSYSEIAESYNISRQGVFDLIKRCDRILEGYEEKLHLLDKFERARNSMEDIRNIVRTIKDKNEDPSLGRLIDNLENTAEEVFSEF
ncbi:hypothetical protein SAMN05660484_00813 [Eubacterium ruminantium]|uniref:UPF0122 protein SAMN02745110_00939 n=2 Tax=Eubacteriaceae TaxID=186806 RepID=A0A1T4LV22_9FIRM|nr:hypothetical protein SAMN05660484_00813 [Eubacterium ruminantium]SDM41852.1 hypothetical protein SAMN04490370_10387 [Eubacterium ruminantium]SJZ58314.1 hypothetical protein SAMN02745110_00939 [Eubacterium ruminantium]